MAVPGFSSEPWGPDARGDTGKILRNDGDPYETHIHRHPDGVTISTYHGDRAIERFNFNTGLQEGRDRPLYPR